MEYRDLELTVISGQGIDSGHGERRVKVYAVVSFSGDPATVQKTDVDREGGTNPIWNRTFTYTIPDLSVRKPGSHMVAKLYYQRFWGDLLVGEVKIPIPTRFDIGIWAFASFKVVPTGTLNISYRFGERFLVRNKLSLFIRRLLMNEGILRPTLAILILSLRGIGQNNEALREIVQDSEEMIPNLLSDRDKEVFDKDIRVVLKLGVHDEKDVAKAMKLVAQVEGVKSLSTDENAKELTIVGEVDLIKIVGILRKYCLVELVSVGPAMKKDEGASESRFGTSPSQDLRTKGKGEGASESHFGTSSSQDLRMERKDEGTSEFHFGTSSSQDLRTEIKDEGTSEFHFGTSSSQDLRTKRKDEGTSEFHFGTSSSQDLRTKRKDERASESRFGSSDGGQTEETNDEAKSDRNKRYLEDFILFCSVFPLDYEFTKDIFICQRIARGLIELGEDEETEEVCTEECFDTMMDMNYIIPSGYNYVLDQTKYKIGDKMTTFLQNQVLEPKVGKYLDSKQSHHDRSKIELVSLTFKEIDHAVLKQYSRLHTLVIHDCYEVDHLPSDLFSELKALKILILSRTNIVELPKSVENLKELLFLDMSETPLVWLPETICCFTQLQTLRLDGCLQLEGLPEGTSNLINLRHLILDVVRQLESMPVGIGKLSNLRTLSAFLVGEEEGCSVRELKDMNKLRGSFRLLNLENVGTKEEASEAYLLNKVDLRKIDLQWSDVQDEEINPHEEEILESLKPGVGIQELKILFYSGGGLPSWICDPSFQNLVTIFLYKCRYCISLPSLGELPSLKHLNIIENKEVVEIGSYFCRKKRNQYHAAFPKLEKLTFESMSRLEKWTGLEKGDFPSLRHLIIEYCPEFMVLPYLLRLDSLSHLEIRYCPKLSLLPNDKLPPSLQSLMIKESPRLKEWFCEEDCSKIADVPTVYFDHQLMIKESARLKEWCCEEDCSKIADVPTVYFDRQKFPPEM